MLWSVATNLLLWLGFKDSLARKAAPYLLALAGGVLLILAFLLWDWWDDRRAVADYRAKVAAEAADSRDKAADERAADVIRNERNREDLHNVIDSAPGGRLSPAAHALACERLRKLGRVPAACGPESGNGTKADPR